MKFSIVITTHNRLSLLRRAIDSAIAQTEFCEIIVVDDGSSDGTIDYLNNLGSRIILHRNSVTLGHSASMNLGVKLATGDWIKPLDDDDYLASCCIKSMSDAIALHPKAVILSSLAIQVNQQGERIGQTIQVGSGTAFFIPQSDIHYGMFLEQIPFGTTSQVAFSRQDFLEVGGWDPNLSLICDDIDFWIRIAQQGDAIFVNQCLTYRTMWPGGLNHAVSIEKRLAANVLMKERIYPYIHNKYAAVSPSLQEICQYLNLHWSLVAIKQKSWCSFLKIGFPAFFSLFAWKHLFSVMVMRRWQWIDREIRRYEL